MAADSRRSYGDGRRSGGASTLRVDPIACDAHGLCAELLPEWISLDEWGYPVIPRDPLPGRLRRHAEQAVGACPALALALRREEAPRPPDRR